MVEPKTLEFETLALGYTHQNIVGGYVIRDEHTYNALAHELTFSDGLYAQVNFETEMAIAYCAGYMTEPKHFVKLHKIQAHDMRTTYGEGLLHVLNISIEKFTMDADHITHHDTFNPFTLVKLPKYASDVNTFHFWQPPENSRE